MRYVDGIYRTHHNTESRLWVIIGHSLHNYAIINPALPSGAHRLQVWTADLNGCLTVSPGN